MKPVIDVACGSRMFWFDRQDERGLFMDIRAEEHWLTDSSSKGGRRFMKVEPDVIGDFTQMQFPDESFSLVVFDPPHLTRAGLGGWQAKKYGKLPKDWQGYLRKGFEECFRILRPHGVLIFKWNETNIPVSQILALTAERPLIGQKCGRREKTHWIVFMKSSGVGNEL